MKRISFVFKKIEKKRNREYYHMCIIDCLTINNTRNAYINRSYTTLDILYHGKHGKITNDFFCNKFRVILSWSAKASLKTNNVSRKWYAAEENKSCILLLMKILVLHTLFFLAKLLPNDSLQHSLVSHFTNF